MKSPISIKAHTQDTNSILWLNMTNEMNIKDRVPFSGLSYRSLNEDDPKEQAPDT